jgi:hypothetical protein
MNTDKGSLLKKWWFAIPVILSAVFTQEWIFEKSGYGSDKAIRLSEIVFNTEFFADVFIGFSVFFTLLFLYSYLGKVLLRRIWSR